MSNTKTVFHVHTRESATKTKQLRRESKIPANVFGLSMDSEAIQFDSNAFRKLYDSVGETGLVYLKIDDQKEQPTLIDDVAYQSVGNTILHVTFRRVNLKVAITAAIPVELVGECDVPGATVVQIKQEIEVEALPADLPESFEVSIDTLKEVGDSITLADLKIDTSKVTFVLAEGIELENEAVVILQGVAEEVEAEEEASETSEAEAAPKADDTASADAE